MVAAGGPSKPRRQPFDLVGGFLIYAGGLVFMVFVLSWMVAGTEAEALAEGDPVCAGRPTTYPLALRWMLSRTLLHDPPGLAPATPWLVFVGWLVSLASLVGAGLLVSAFRQRRTVNAGVIQDRAEGADGLDRGEDGRRSGWAGGGPGGAHGQGGSVPAVTRVALAGAS